MIEDLDELDRDDIGELQPFPQESTDCPLTPEEEAQVIEMRREPDPVERLHNIGIAEQVGIN